MIFFRSLFLLIILGCGGWTANAREQVKIATVHFGPIFQDVATNRARLVALTEEAARNGAKIVVHTEMATSGYAFFSRAEIAKVAERIDGPTANALGSVAKTFGIYVVIGLPTVEPATGQFFNSAILIGPQGGVEGVYHKRSSLLEASYNAVAGGPIPTFETPYGRIAIVICADLFYPHIPRLAAISGAEILLAPANVGVEIDFLKVRAFENDFAVVVANRYGKEGQGVKQQSFSQETFAIPSPFPYEFNWGSRSAIVTANGQVVSDFSEQKDAIGYAVLPAKDERTFPVVRRPELYALMANDTLEPYTVTQMQLPAPVAFAAAAVDPGPDHRDAAGAIGAVEAAITAAQDKGWTLRLATLPEGLFDVVDEAVVSELSKLVDARGVDVVVPFRRAKASENRPLSLLLAARRGQPCEVHRYYRSHRLRNESATASGDFFIIDRDYGRVAILHGEDLAAPETSIVMAKMGVDILAVSANSADSTMPSLWRTRTGDYLHLIVANNQGPEAIYLGGYKADPSQVETEGLALMSINVADVRLKKEPRYLDVTPLLAKCDRHNC